MDSVGLVTGQYKVKMFPTAFLIDTEGIVKKALRQVFKNSEEIENIVSSIIENDE